MPLLTLPEWVHRIAPATPQYWAMRGFSGVILDGQGFWAVLLPTAMLMVFAGGFALVAAIGFRATEARLSFG